MYTHIRCAHKRVNMCSECNIYFLCLLDKEKHLEEVHAETASKCIYCNVVFNTKNLELRKHMKDFHLNSTVWRCSNRKCNKEFFTELERNNHLSRAHYKIQEKRFECIYNNCKKTFVSTVSLTRHLEKEHDGIYFRCDYNQNCASNFKSKEEVAEHVKNVHENYLSGKLTKCLHCLRNIRLTAMKRHMKYFHKHENIFRCRYMMCVTFFKSENERRAHEFEAHVNKAVNTSATCRYCQMIITHNSNIHRHLRVHHKNLAITFCKCGYYGSAIEVQNHCMEKHQSGAIKCVYCGIFYRKEYHLRHIKSNHKSQTIFKCTFKCYLFFLSESDRDEHIFKVHSKAPLIQKFVCTYCQATLSTKHVLHTHVQNLHKQISFKCSLRGCGEFFLSQSDKNSHYLEKHQDKEKNKFLKCPKCNYKTDVKLSMSMHMARLHSTSPTVTCPKCSVVFKSQISLDIHLSRVHQKSRYKKCQHCKNCVLNLKQHQRWTKCEYCQKVTPCVIRTRQHVSVCKIKKLS